MNKLITVVVILLAAVGAVLLNAGRVLTRDVLIDPSHLSSCR